jgi:hypothetical protein
MRASASRRHLAAITAVAALLAGCHGRPVGRAGADTASDGGVEGAAAVVAFDADVPPDDAVPSTANDELGPRARHLLEAIVKDDSGLASDILFPRDAWIATRDSADPGKDWTKHVAAPFRRSVHALSKRHLGVDPQFVSLEIGHSMQQETPRKHGWKKALWTVRESRLTFTVDGRTRVLSIREMTAWRGAWYVTRLR